jgi:hypothetical protein
MKKLEPAHLINNLPLPKQEVKKQLVFPSVVRYRVEDNLHSQFCELYFNNMFESDSNSFPNHFDATCRCNFSADNNEQMLLGSNTFFSKLKDIRKIVILDSYFDLIALRKLETIFSFLDRSIKRESFEIVGYPSNLTCDKETALIINKLRAYFVTVELWCFKSAAGPRFVHDRFALLDSELFHFGGNVGGTQKGVTAFSYGWPESGFNAFVLSLKEQSFITRYPNAK